MCGKVFIPRNSLSRYCKDECRKMGLQLAVERQRARRTQEKEEKEQR